MLACSLLVLVALAASATAPPPPPVSAVAAPTPFSYKLQLVPVPEEPKTVRQPVYLPVQHPNVLYVPVVNKEPEKQAQQYTVLRVDSSSQAQGLGSIEQTTQPIPVQQAIPVPVQHVQQSPQINGVQVEGVHHPPPPPAGATSSYVATLSYGPDHPSVIYNCYLPGHQLPPVNAAYVVKGSNSYVCAVTYVNSGNYHIVHVLSNEAQAPEVVEQKIEHSHIKLP